MKIQIKKSQNVVLACVVIALTFSCNRGYGCPSNFSFTDLIADAIKMVISLFF
jgi:hypothetical protein